MPFSSVDLFSIPTSKCNCFMSWPSHASLCQINYDFLMFPTFLNNFKWRKGKSSLLTLSKKKQVSIIDKTLFGKQFLESLPNGATRKMYHKKLGKLPYTTCNKGFINLGHEFLCFTHLDKKVCAKTFGMGLKWTFQLAFVITSNGKTKEPQWWTNERHVNMDS